MDTNIMTDVKYPTILVDLPSKGKLYNLTSPLAEGVVELKYGSMEEESILTTISLINKGTVLDELLKSLLINKEIDIKELIIGDKNALIVAARRAMYGDKYAATITCPSCGVKEKLTTDLSELKTFEIDDTVEKNSFEMTTSDGRNIKYHLLSGYEIDDIKKTAKRAKKLGLSTTNNDLVDRLVASIDDIDGTTNKKEIKEILLTPGFSLISQEIRTHMLAQSPDIDLNIDFTCGECGYDDLVEISLDTDFFWPTGKRSRRSI